MTAAFTVSFDVAGGPWAPTTNLLSFAMSAGRQNALDTYGASTAELVIRRVSANTADLDKLVPGIQVTINDSLAVGVSCIFYITDVVNDYGIVSTMDTIVVTMEGTLALANRAYLDDYNLGADTITNQIVEIAGEAALNLGVSTLNDPQVDGTTVTSVADWLQQLTTTVNGRLDDTYDLFLYDRYTFEAFTDLSGGKTLVFSDGTVALTAADTRIYYDQLTFSSLSENYYTRAIVDPENHAAQISTASGATAPYRVLQLDTFNANTSQAQDYADFLVSTYSDPTHKRISSLSVDGASTNAGRLFANLGGYAISKTCRIIFRGTTYNATIEGWAYTATPEDDRYTFYFSGADLNNYLILDDTDRGVLDANRLGY